MKKPIIFLIATVFGVMNAAYSPENENYDVESLKNLSHTQQLFDHEEDHEWLESSYEVENDDDVLTPMEDGTAAEGAPEESNLLERFKRAPKLRYGKRPECRDGQVKSEKTGKCVPKCKTCKFGECISTEKCKCEEGYYPSGGYTCKPKCYSSCTLHGRGRCNEPGRCTCETGFQLEKDNITCRAAKCKPKCKSFEICAKDNICVCAEGYEKPQPSAPCKAQCLSACPTHKCDYPWACTCEPGYVWNPAIKKCNPVCEHPRCEAGFSCVSPEKCDCKNGFLKNETITTSLGATVKTVCINRGTNSALTSSTIFVLIGIIFTFYHM